MKKIISILLILLLSVSFAACSKSGGNFDEEALKKLGENYVAQMVEGNFSEVVKGMSAACKEKLPEETLKTGWESSTQNLGSFVSTDGVTVKTDGIQATVTVQNTFESNGLKVIFTFNKANKIEGINITYSSIPEPPKETDLFIEEMVNIGSSLYPVKGKLTLPKNTENPPVVLLIQGSGASDMDETIGAGANKPFQDIAYGLAEMGIATLRFDKRFYTYPEDAIALGLNITIQDEILNDVDSALSLLLKTDSVDRDRIYVLGHSLGGMLAPKIAQDHEEVKGIISLAGSPRGLEDIILDQNRNALNDVPNLTEDQKKEYLSQVEAEVNKVKALKEEDEATLILSQPSKYWYSLKEASAEKIAPTLTIPMLILQGEEDFQIFADQDFNAWKELLGEKETVTYKIYPGLNHLFMPTTGKKDITDYDTKSTVDPTVIKDIGTWIQGLE